MTLYSRYTLLFALVIAMMLSALAVTNYYMSPPTDQPEAGMSDGGLMSHSNGWSWND